MLANASPVTTLAMACVNWLIRPRSCSGDCELTSSGISGKAPGALLASCES